MKRQPRVDEQHCDTCRWWQGSVVYMPEHECSRGHRPNFYLPKSPDDTTYGYKRRCEDWREKEQVWRSRSTV